MKVKRESEVTQLYLTLSDPVDRSLPGSSVHGIFQARILEWDAISFSNISLVERLTEEKLMSMHGTSTRYEIQSLYGFLTNSKYVKN